MVSIVLLLCGCFGQIKNILLIVHMSESQSTIYTILVHTVFNQLSEPPPFSAHHTLFTESKLVELSRLSKQKHVAELQN